MSIATTGTGIDLATAAPTRAGRVDRLLAALRRRMTQTQTTWGEHLTVLDDPNAGRMPLVVRQAQALELLLGELPIAIEPDDLIMGNSLRNGVVVRPAYPAYATAAEHRQAAAEGRTIEAGLSHKTPSYADVIGRGLGAIIADIEAREQTLKAQPPSADRGIALAQYEAMRIACRACIGLAQRYADLATELAGAAPSGWRRDELQAMARVARRVPELPARSFHEALQAFWFVHHSLFSAGSNFSCGRLDQYAGPALEDDLNRGAISIDDAQELVDCLWLRFNDRAQIERDNFALGDAERDWRAGHRIRRAFATDRYDAINHFGQNIVLSGLRPDGTDGTNRLTYLLLNAGEKFQFTSPVFTVRLHRDSPPELLTRAAEVLKTGGGMPYIFNDEALVPAYQRLGVPAADARAYVNSNCWETMIEGKSDQELIRGINFLLCVELALNRGIAPVTGEREGPDTGDPATFVTFDDLVEAWKTQLDHLIKAGIDHIGLGLADGSLEHSSHGAYRYSPLLSALNAGCVEHGQDAIRGGSRHTIWHVMGEAVANAIDALAAIKQLVYDERSLSMPDLLDVLAADWDGYEMLRQRSLARLPSFGNDLAAADDIGRRLMEWFVERTRRHAARYPGTVFPAAVGTFSWYAMIGKEMGATPDGRHAGDPVAANLSPAVGRDLSGPTAALNSYLKMPVDALAAGAPIDLFFAGGGLRGSRGTARLAGFIKAFIDLGGNMLTCSVTDADELKRAMAEPEKYRGLRVRMGGWSAYFVMLSREQQLLHIRKVEHGLA